MSGGPGNFLLEKAEAFALRIVRLYRHLSEKGERVMSKQVQDSQIENLKFRHSYFIRHTSYFAICAGDRLVLRAGDAEDAWRGELWADGRLSGGGNGKICGIR